MPYLNNQSLIEVARKYNKRIFSELDDKQVYDYIVKNMRPEDFSDTKGIEFSPWVDEQSKIDTPYEYKPYKPVMIDSTTQQSTSPKSWMQTFSDMSLTGWAGDATDWNFLKYSAMQGSQDLLKAAMSGESSYQLKDENGQVISPEEYGEQLNIGQEVLAWGLGQFNATDIALWVGTAGIGKYMQMGGKLATVGKTTQRLAPSMTKAETARRSSITGIKDWNKWVDKGLSTGTLSDEAYQFTKKEYFDGMVRKSANRLRANGNRYSNYFADYLEAAPAGAVSLGAFSFGTGAIHSLNQQRMAERDADGIGIGDVDAGTALWDGAKSGFEGMVLGGLIAGVSPGTDRIFGKMATKFEKAETSLGQSMQKFFKSDYTKLAADIGIEGTVFSTAPYTWKGLPRDEEGNIDTDQMLHDWAHSTATIGMLKGSFKAYEKIMNEWKGEIAIDKEYAKNGEFRTTEGEMAKDVVENMKKNLTDMGLKPAEVQKAVKEFLKEEFGKTLKEVDGVELEVKEALLEKWEANQGIVNKIVKGEKLTKEEAAIAFTELGPLNTILGQMEYKKIATTEAIDAYIDKYIAPEIKKRQGKDITPEQREIERNKITKKVKSRIEKLDKESNAINDFISNAKSKGAKKETLAQREKAMEKEYDSLSKLLDDLPDGSARKKAADKLIENFSKENREAVERVKEGKTGESTPKELDTLEAFYTEVRKIVEGPSAKERIKEATESLQIELPKDKWEALIKEKTVKGNDAKTAENLERVLAKVRTSKETTDAFSEVKRIVEENKILDSKEQSIPLVKDSNISKSHKTILAYVLDALSRNRNHARGAKETINLLKFVEKKYKKDINTLDSKQLETLGKDYIQDKLKVDIYDKTTDTLSKKYTMRQIRAAQRAADLIRDSLAETFRFGAMDKFANNTNIVGNITKFNVSGTRKVTIVGGEKGFKRLIQWAKNFKKPIEYAKGKSIDSNEAAIAIELAVAGKLRPGELAGFKVSDIDPRSGRITIRRQKREPSQDIVNKELASKLITLANKKGIKGETNLFNFKSSSDVTSFTKHISEKSGIEIKVEHAATGKIYKWNEMIPGEKSIGSIDIPSKKAGAGLQMGRVFRGLYEAEPTIKTGKEAKIETAKQAAELGHTGEKSPTKSYRRKTIEERMTVEGKVGRAATAKEKARVIRMLKKKYPEITLKLDEAVLRDSKGKVITSDKVLETVVGTLVKVKKGAPIEAAVHGAIHPILKTLDAISKANPNTKLGKTTAGLVREMYARARKTDRFQYWRKEFMKDKYDKNGKLIEKGMNPKDAANRAVEEVTAELTGKYVAGRMMDKGVFQRVKDWFQRTYAALKTSFKDVDKMTDKELTQLFGERFIKRKGIDSIVFERTSGERMEFMTITKENTKDFKKYIDDTMKRFNLDVTAAERNKFLEVLAKEAKIDMRPDFSLKNILFEEITAISEVIGTLNLRKIKEKSKIKERIEFKMEIDRNREKTNLTTKDQKEWLVNEGVASGNILDAPMSTMKEFNSLLYEYRVDPKSLNQVGNELPVLVDKKIDIINRIQGSRLAKLRHFASKGLMGLHQFSKHLGLTNLASWTLKHISSEQAHVGPFMHFADTMAPQLLGRRKWNQAKKVFSLLEANEKGEFIRINDKTVTSKEAAQAKLFIKKAFKVRVDRKTGKWYNEGINWNPKNQTGSNEGRLLHYFKHEIMNSLPEKLDAIALSKFTKGKYESILKQNDIKFLNKSDVAFYVPRRTTRVFQENFNLNALKENKAVEKAASEIAYEMAKDANQSKWKKLSKSEKEKLVDEYSDAARIIANAELQMIGTFGAQKIQFNHLIKRNRIKLDETIDIGGKKVKVWETDFDTSIMPFAAGWGKFLANVEHAPWAIKLKGFKFDVDMNKTLTELQASMGLGAGNKRMKDINNIIKKGIQRRVGTYQENSMFSSLSDYTREYTSTLMRLQLAGPIPMSGIKNYFTQAIQMVHAHRFRDVIDTHFRAFSAKERAVTEMMGATSSIGITGYKPKSELMQKATDLVFRSGLMPLSESFARTWARLAAEVDGRRMADIVQKNTKNSKEYKQAVNRLKELYELTDSQIALLKRHGFEPLYNKMSAFDKNVIKLQMDGIDRQIQIVGNMKTAGSTVDAMMPEIGNVKWMKPFLMYKRIAYATTVNNMSTMKYNWNNGHFMRTAMMVGGTALSGGARMWLLKQVLGQTLPGENSDWGKAIQTALWQGEFGGILSELLSPYAGTWGSLSNDMLFSSAMTTHAWKSVVLLDALGGNYSGIWETSSTPGEALRQWGRSTSASYNNIYKLMSQRNNEYNSTYKSIRQWKNDFEGKHGYYEDPSIVESESKKYFKNLRTAFNLGNTPELNEAVTLAYFGYASDRVTAGASQAQAFKEAKSMISRTFKTLNPIMGSIDSRKGYIITPTQGFLKSLSPEKKKVVKRAYKQYNERLRMFLKQYPHYLRKNNLKDIKENFKFTIKEQYGNALK
tara:strand:+ start:6530 stop:13939 length:7410 start_codon:yes stop_codon:yes gene_type:complete